MASEGVNPDGSHRERADQLARQAHLFAPGPTLLPSADATASSDSSPPKAWATPRAEDGERVSRGTADTLTSQTARLTGQRAAYNPRFGLWLMGMPTDWLDVPVIQAPKKPGRGRRPGHKTKSNAETRKP